jgi:hypothetical protein
VVEVVYAEEDELIKAGNPPNIGAATGEGAARYAVIAVSALPKLGAGTGEG